LRDKASYPDGDAYYDSSSPDVDTSESLPSTYYSGVAIQVA